MIVRFTALLRDYSVAWNAWRLNSLPSCGSICLAFHKDLWRTKGSGFRKPSRSHIERERSHRPSREGRSTQVECDIAPKRL